MPKTLESLTKRLNEHATDLELSIKLQPLQDFEDAKRLLATRKDLVERTGETFYLAGWDNDARKCLQQSDGSYLSFQPQIKLGNSTRESQVLITAGSTLERGNSRYLVTKATTSISGTSFEMEYLSSSFTIAGKSQRHPCTITNESGCKILTCSGNVANQLEKQILIDGVLHTVKSEYMSNATSGVKRYEIIEGAQ